MPDLLYRASSRRAGLTAATRPGPKAQTPAGDTPITGHTLDALEGAGMAGCVKQLQGILADDKMMMVPVDAEMTQCW